VPCLVGAGVLAAIAVYLGTRRWLIAIAVGLLVSAATFVAALLVTLARWEG
jgi:hypothetical protein